MNRLQLGGWLLIIGLSAARLEAGSKPLTVDDLESWKRISETVVSPDGKWIAYRTEPGNGDAQVFVYSAKGERRFEHVCGTGLQFTDDSQHLVFTIVPADAQVREFKRQSGAKATMPSNQLGIYSLGAGRFEAIDDVRNYKLPEAWAGWLAYQVEPRGSKQAEDKPTPKRESKETGFALRLRDLSNGENRSWPFVTEYWFAAKARHLFFVSTGDDQEFAAGLYRFDVESGQLQVVMGGAGDYRQTTVADMGDRVAFLYRPPAPGERANFGLYLWTGEGQAAQVVTSASQGIPTGWRVSEHGRVFFSARSGKVFFGTAPVRPSRDPSILEDEFPELDIWHGHEDVLHTEQLVNRDRELRRTYLAVYDAQARTVAQVETVEIPESRVLAGGDGDHVLLHSGRPYELESMWDPQRYDVYLLDLATGQRRTVVKGTRDRVEPSPGGKYLLWFNYADYSYYTYELDSGEQHRITTPDSIRADTETNTTFDYNAPYGVAEWCTDDRAVLIYDRYDLWKVDPENRVPPENLTVNGRQERIVYRLLRLGRQEAFDEHAPQYLLGTNEVTRATGYYRYGPGSAAAPRQLIGGAYRLSRPWKARDADTAVYTRETFNEFPDLWVSDLEFRESVRISQANPQQAEFQWGTAELYRWTSLDGRKLDGLLFKPEGFDPARRYPMIVQFFHKSSDQLFDHRIPGLQGSRIDYHYFVSNGYIVFTPDIYFDAGYIGESAYKSILPGVTALIDEGFVDPQRIGAQGHSYSGYQVAYLVTRTNIFACVEAGAPVVNFFSAYGGIRWETGRSRVAQYEHDQTLAPIWGAPLRFLENSPLFALDKITTPVLILHNDHDGAVPWTQGIEFFIGLRRLQRPAWLLNYNGEGHSIKQPKNRRDFQIRLGQFFGHYLKGEPMPEWMHTGVPAVEKDYNLGYELRP